MMTGSAIMSTKVGLRLSNPKHSRCSHLPWPSPKSFKPSFLNLWTSPQTTTRCQLANKNVSRWSDLSCTRRKTSYLHTRFRKYSIVPHAVSLSLSLTVIFFWPLPKINDTYHINDIQKCTPWNFLNNLCWVSLPRWNLHRWCAPKYVTPIPRTMRRHHLAFGIVAQENDFASIEVDWTICIGYSNSSFPFNYLVPSNIDEVCWKQFRCSILFFKGLKRWKNGTGNELKPHQQGFFLTC